MIEAAPLLGRFSRVQLQIIKKRLKKLFGLTAEHVERLHMLGKNQIPLYLAKQERSILPSVWRGLPSKVKNELANPDKIVDILTPKGKKSKFSGELNSFEWHQYIEPNRGVRTLDEQRRFLLPISAPDKKISAI